MMINKKRTKRLSATMASGRLEYLIFLLLLILEGCSESSSETENKHLRIGDRLQVRSFNHKKLVEEEESARVGTRSALKAQELAEGLTLETPGQRSNSVQQEQQWPLQQLERIKSEAKVSALVGQNVILNCAVQFKDGIEKPFVVNWLKYPNKLPIYIWYAGYPPHVAQGYENRVSRIGQASLNLTQVRESDQGLYECKIYYLDRGPEDKANGTWIFLDVQAPPHFTVKPTPISYVQAGDSLQLTCQAESTPSPILRWYRNKSPIEADTGAYRLTSSTSLAAHNSLPGASSALVQLELHIDNVQAGSTTGDYTCLASNSEGSIESLSQVVLAVPAVITTMPRNQTRLEGERVELLCQAKALPANITYNWFFNDKQIKSLKWFEARHSIKSDGTLVIHSLHREDQGEYKCRATNGLSWPANTSKAFSNKTIARAIYAEASAHLLVEYPARITYTPSVQYLPQNLAGIIRCFVSASPTVEFFTWTLNNQQFDPNADPNVERLANGSLLIKQVSKQYEGKYRCTPFNKHGSAGSSGPMEVRVEEAPEFELKPAEFYKATINGQVRIPCDARGSPKPSVSWRRVQSSSAPEQAKPIVSSSSSMMMLEDEPASEDQHLYPETSSAVRQSDSGSVNEGKEEQQSVIVYAKLPSERSEYKNSHLLLHGLRKEDHGRYECVIENEVATLIASTMLYIEETTPHAPLNLQVDTKAWSAQLSWTPGYDGGFEQSFVVWYRQVPEASQPAKKIENGLPTMATSSSFAQSSVAHPNSLSAGQEHHEMVDFNWKSVNVQPSDATSFTVQNLSQDTSYEFYVRAKNIIGEGPRSQVQQANTKRAISGSLATINLPEVAASMSSASNADSDSPNTMSVATANDDEETEQHTINPSVMGIIHLVDVTTVSSTSLPVASSSSDNQSASSSNSGQLESPNASDESSNKVIRIYFPSKQTNSTTDQSSTNSNNVKRPRFEPTDDSSNHSTQPTQAPMLDLSTAPQNVSITKVAQGWVINWWPPERLAQPVSALERIEAAAATNLLEAGQLTHTDSVSIPSASSSSRSVEQQQPAAYSVEFREKGGAWQTFATSKERSLLLKDLKAGAEYSFRVFAHSQLGPTGQRGAPSAEFKYLIPDNRRKPGSTQALSAGVVSGILFFIACIVIAVCAVNMCNKRRKKRAEKAAYVMMACPVLESHHDIAALNSNSLMKNGANSAQDRISGVNLAKNLQLTALKSRLLGALFWLNKSNEAPAKQDQEEGLEEEQEVHIKFTGNAPLPVDVGPSEQLEGKKWPAIDDYWVRQPSNRKWGTLTLAGSKLAERRAREKQQQQRQQASCQQAAEANRESALESCTLPRSFKASRPIRSPTTWVPANNNGHLNNQQPDADAKDASSSSWRAPERIDANQPQTDNQQQSDYPSPPRRFFHRHAQQLHQRSLSQVEPPVAAGYWLCNFSPLVSYSLQQQQQPQQQLFPDSYLEAQMNSVLSSTYFRQLSANGSSYLGGLVPMNLHHQTGAIQNELIKRNSINRSTLPLAAPPSGWMPQQFENVNNEPICVYSAAPTEHAPNSLQQQLDLDDPITDNACLGSYKRKRRLPHIEAQFTITPPELPAGVPERAREREALAEGQLFVRGLPQAGQRTEQRRLRPVPPEPLAQVDTIGPEEKIESYLRHYENLQQRMPEDNHDTDDLNSTSTLSSKRSRSPIELEQLDHEPLTFQPYHNLPSLKYTINLPVRRANNGKLVLEETSHLKRAAQRPRRRRRHQVQSANAPLRAPLRLGSSSSCPATTLQPPADFCAPSSSRLSLEGALERPTVGHASFAFRSSVAARDSLEKSLERMEEPFYLRNSRQLDCSIAREPEQQPSASSSPPSPPPPPPVPPHRHQLKKEEESLQRDESKLNSSSSQQSTSSSSSSSSPSNGGAMSESLTNDHSVDENYEFDLISSSSSSANRRSRLNRRANQLLSLNGKQTKQTEPVYTQVTKKNTTRYYDYSSRCKEQQLTTFKGSPVSAVKDFQNPIKGSSQEKADFENDNVQEDVEKKLGQKK